MNLIIKKNSIFFILYLFFLSCALTFNYYMEMGGLVLYFQETHTPTQDLIFFLLTSLFEFPYLLAYFLVLLLWSYRFLLISVLGYIFSSITVQVLKRFFSYPRPSEFFQTERGIELYSYITSHGENLPHWNSFPSGHTTTAFLFLTMSAFFLPSRCNWIPLFLAILIGLSRIYLGFHFLQDIIVGSLIGVISAVLTYHFFYKKITNFNLRALFKKRQ